jgi:hypothetical protein
MANTFTSQSPLAYPDWIKTQGYNSDISQEAYFAYLNFWYNANNKIIDENNADATPQRQQYIQLIKDLLFLFNKNELDLFLSDIDFNNDEDLIYIIPYLANKLKQITQIISEKREEIKRAKTKHSLIGSSEGLEKILYEYVLKNFTSKPYSWTRVPISPLANRFPQLSSINSDFYIEIEELYDTNNYHDSDPSVPISKYLNIDELLSKEPFASLSDKELSDIVTSRLLLRLAPTRLSHVFNEYLTVSPHLSTTSLSALSANYSTSIFNQIAANQKYLGETVYGLTAIKTVELNNPDYVLGLNVAQGNNWFYWPSGDKIQDETQVGNIYAPIHINQSNLVLNRTVSGSDYTNSDLIFTDKNGVLEGAWLQGKRERITDDTMSVKLKSSEYTTFIFPFVGFDIDSKDLSFKNYSLNDNDYILFEQLDPTLRTKILSAYYNHTLPNSAAHDIYLNQTSLIECSARAGYFSDEADTIVKTPSSFNYYVWNDIFYGKIEEAFLYKFEKTDILIKRGVNDILWPIESFTGGTDNLTLTLSSNTCLPIVLGSLDPRYCMVGAVAGRSFASADVIYKLGDNGGTPIEAAWLGSGSVTQLNQLKNPIKVYNTKAVNCAQFFNGPISPSLSMIMEPGMFNSFVWMDEDTPADQVFFYHDHSPNCPFNKSYPHDFFKSQEYQNPTPLNNGMGFPLTKNPCTCRSIYYSPIGSEGKTVVEYNGMADLLFADPQGLGPDFSYTSWRDTRNFNPYTSPQFSFYQLDGTMDREVGFGTGTWMTGVSSQPMILKTGRRYTYYRSNLRVNEKSTTIVPYLLSNYPYKHINVTCGPDFNNIVDLVIVIDNSRTQYFDIEIVKKIAVKFCEIALSSNVDVKISIVSFNEHGIILNYMTDNLASCISHIATIITPPTYPEWLTNIVDGLTLANNVLFTTKPDGNNCAFGDISQLCKGVNQQVINQSNISTITNCPRPNAAKHILLFSDGQETVNEGLAGPYAQELKATGVNIMAVDIGYYALTDKLMKQIASEDQYFNLEEYLLYSDVDLDTFTQNIVTLILGCFPALPVWCKAVRNSNGNWSEAYTISDMVLRPGDYLAYVHQSETSYTGAITNTSFTIPSLAFAMNVKLDGWDYNTHSFNLTGKGDLFGARPFWGKTETPSATSFPIGGTVRTEQDYVIIHQPKVSDMILKNGNYIKYNNSADNFITWKQDLTFTVYLSDQRWNKLILNKADSNLEFALNTKILQDLIVHQSDEPSDLMLESYSSLRPSKYNLYLANSAFYYTENLYYLNRCNESFVVFTSGVAVEAAQPHLNLDSVHYATIANIAFPSTFVTESQIGKYLLPDRLGVPYYRGKGYQMELDPTSISYLDSLSAERLFLDINKYASRNRGLTLKDQLAPVRISDIDLKWMIEPFGSGNYGGTIIDTINNQKMIPYQSNYEVNQRNQIGMCLQRDDFQFWSPKVYDQWTNEKFYPLTFRNELVLENFLNRLDSLLVDVGTQSVWRTDIYGNNFALYKNYGDEKTHHIITEKGLDLKTELGIRFETEV